MIFASIIAGAVVVAIAFSVAVVILFRRRCPHCRRRGLAPEGRGVTEDRRHYQRVRCVHCKAEFAALDGGYVPIDGAVVIPEAKATERER